MNKFLFGVVAQDLDQESGEAVDADGLGAIRGSFIAIPFALLFWGAVIVLL